MNNSRKYLIMLGGASDVQEELKLARDTINKWNDAYYMSDISLQPIDWNNNTFPSFGNHPQKEINKQLTNTSDLLVCVIGGKLGTPTDTHQSGTIEEIDEHVKANKPVMVFIRKQNDSTNVSDLMAVQEYIKTISSKCLFVQFDNTNCFKDIFRDKLTLFMNKIIQDSNEVQNFPQESFSDSPMIPEISRLINQINNDVVMFESLRFELNNATIYELGDRIFIAKEQDSEILKKRIINNAQLLKANILSLGKSIEYDIKTINDAKTLINNIITENVNNHNFDHYMREHTLNKDEIEAIWNNRPIE